MFLNEQYASFFRDGKPYYGSGWVSRKHAGQLYFLRRRLSDEKTVWKAERAWFLSRRERGERPWRGNRFAFPLPTLSLPPLLGRFKASCDQGVIPPWNPPLLCRWQISEAEWELVFLAGGKSACDEPSNPPPSSRE